MQARHKKHLEEVGRHREKHLRLTYGELGTVPEAVRGLHWLKSLDVSGNQIRSLPVWLSSLRCLEEVIAFDNPIQKIPLGLPIAVDWSVIERLRMSAAQVRGVSLDWCLKSLPEQFLKLSHLRRLKLKSSGPSTVKFFEEIADRFPLLEYLELYSCNLRALPGAIGRLVQIRMLNLTGNPILSLPESIKTLTRMQELRVSDMGLSILPDWVFALPDLRVLDASKNYLSRLPVAVRQAVRLERLDLSHNPLEFIPDGLAALQRLEYLNLENSNLRQVPASVYSLRQLRNLDLSGHGVDEKGFAASHSRTDLYYPGCQINNIPSEILKLTRLRTLRVDGQPIVTPPREVVSKGLDAIRNYWRQRADTGTDYLCEAKLLIVGEGDAGKSTLAAKVLDPAYVLDPDRPSTEGIDILRWRFGTRIHPRTAGAGPLDRDFDVGIWDFGGQEVYHATHQFFLTRRSLYVLVADSRKEDTDFHYWLGVVRLLAGDSPLIVVKNEKQDRRWDLDEASLRARFPNVKEVLATNLATNRGLDEVVRRIRHHLEGLPHIGDALPATWKRVREVLEGDDRDYIPLVEFLDLCRRHGFTRDGDKLQLSAYLHDLGICLHFQDDPVLKHTVILRPSWGTDAVYRVLDDAGVAAGQGHFSGEDLTRIWDGPEHAGMQDELLRLMMKFQLCYELPGGVGYIAPQLLQASRPAYDWDQTRDLVLRWVYDFMPKGILTRLTVATHPYIAEAGRLVWRSGVILNHEGARCEAVEDYQQRRLTLRAQGPGRKVLLGIVLHELERIHCSFPGLEVQTLVPCNCPQCVGHPEPGAFSYIDLVRAARNAQPIQCRRSFEMVDAAGLIDAVFERGEGPRGGGAVIPRRERTASASAPAEAPEVFVSYAWRADTAIVDALTDALTACGLPVTRDTNELRYKDPIRAFMQRAGRSRAAVLVLSEAYLRSPNCMFELIEIAKGADLRGRVFPVVLDGAAIHDPLCILDHIEYWERKINELDVKMKRVEGSNLEGVRETLDLYREIRATIARLTDILADMNHLTSVEHAESGFASLAEAVAVRIDSSARP